MFYQNCELNCFFLRQGRGYSLSADIQHVDARWKVPIVLPLRDCVRLEISRLCVLDGFVYWLPSLYYIVIVNHILP